VEQALKDFGDLFSNAPARRHLAEYLTGLLVAERRTVNGINAEFVVTTDQSCLNRWIIAAGWDPQALNLRRLAWLQRFPDTRYASRAHGVIAIDNVLIDHDGKFIEDVGWLWDHADQRYVIAHDTRHMYLVLLVHSLLMVQLRQDRVREWATATLTTIGEACRAVLRETLRKTITWAIDRATQDRWPTERITTHLALA
jgi:hypothetical protein